MPFYIKYRLFAKIFDVRSRRCHIHCSQIYNEYDIFPPRKQKMSRRKRGTKTLVGPIWPMRQVSTEHILRGAANVSPRHRDGIAIIDIAQSTATATAARPSWRDVCHIRRCRYHCRWRRQKIGSVAWFGARWTVLVIALVANDVIIQ